MDLSTTPEQYTPGIDNSGMYVDRKPYMQNGLRCACTGHMHTYKTRASFSTHTKSQRHKSWLAELNANRMNYYSQLQNAERNVRDQRRHIAEQGNKIARLETDVAAYRVALAAQRERCVPTTNDLITFD